MNRMFTAALLTATLLAVPMIAQAENNHFAEQAENSHLAILTGLTSNQLAQMTMEEISIVIQLRRDAAN